MMGGGDWAALSLYICINFIYSRVKDSQYLSLQRDAQSRYYDCHILWQLPISASHSNKYLGVVSNKCKKYLDPFHCVFCVSKLCFIKFFH